MTFTIVPPRKSVTSHSLTQMTPFIQCIAHTFRSTTLNGSSRSTSNSLQPYSLTSSQASGGGEDAYFRGSFYNRISKLELFE